MSDEELKFELVYITESPPEEHGGFNPRVVEAAKAALLVLAERDAAYAVLERIIKQDDYYFPLGIVEDARELLAKRKA